jgi:hypothetical protein
MPLALPSLRSITRTFTEDNAMSSYAININGRTYNIRMNAASFDSDEALYDALYARAIAIEEANDAERASTAASADNTGEFLVAWSTVSYRSR